MEGHHQHEQHNKSKALKIDSVESWDSYVTQATNQGRPVSFLIFKDCIFCYLILLLIVNINNPEIFLPLAVNQLGFTVSDLSIIQNYFVFN